MSSSNVMPVASGEEAETDRQQNKESKRGRIRRLLFDPLNADGFRKSGKVTADRHRDLMARLADDLTYMSDHSLDVLRDMLRTKGQGRDRDIWPSPATIRGFAELVEPRPLEELPALIRWFRSVEGPKAMQDGTLVETWSYFKRFKRPPVRAQRELQQRAAQNRHKLELIRERIGQGRADEDDTRWLDLYEKTLAYCERLVKAQGRGAAE